MPSMIRQNFTEECEALINKQINMELYASYAYLAMVTFWKHLLLNHVRTPRKNLLICKYEFRYATSFSVQYFILK